MKTKGMSAIVVAACCVLAWQCSAVAAASKETVVYSFCSNGAFHCSDGASAGGSLTDVNGMFYGATAAGGEGDNGVIFALDPRTGKEQVLYSFGGGNDGAGARGSLIHVNGKLYGTASYGSGQDEGALFAYDLSSGAEVTVYGFCSRAKCADGGMPSAGLIDVNGVLYGTTYEGGAHRGGTIFSFNLKTGVESVIHSFGLSGDGQFPLAGLLYVNGTLYGTTTFGGAYLYGTVFSLDLKTGREAVLHSFGSGTDGSMPKAALLDVNGTLYGTTMEGGTYNDGSIFSIDPSTGAETVIHAFNNTDGQWPIASLINVKGVLYGTTFYGGAFQTCGDSFGCGTVFSLDPATGVETVLHSFGGTDLATPDGGLFGGTDGATPDGGLIHVNGGFYGTTERGGSYGYGTVFKLKAIAGH